MKVKLYLLNMFIVGLYSSTCFAQANSNIPRSIISTKASIRTYHDTKSLDPMSKGELVELYIERMKVIVRILPKMGLATQPGITMADLGIPNDNNYKKALEVEKDATQKYLDNTVIYLRKMLPFCDKGQLINVILFYETTLKSLKEIEE